MPVKTARFPPELSAIAMEHRWAILSLIASGVTRPMDIADAIDIKRNLLSYHIDELEKAGVVRRDKDSHPLAIILNRPAIRAIGESILNLIGE